METGSRTTYHGKIRTRGGRKQGTVRTGKQSVYKGVRIIPVGNGEFETSLDSSRFESKRDAQRFIAAWKKQQGNPRRNPTKSLTLARPKDFYASGWGSETAPAGTKVSVWALSNPRGKKGDFSRCVKAVSQRKGAKDPNAICAASERKRGLINPRGFKENIILYDGPSLEQAQMYLKNAIAGGKYIGLKMRGRKGSWLVSADDIRSSGRSNPAASAQAVSEEFHGRPVREMVPVQQKRHYHKYLAELGELRKLVVESRDGKHRVTLSGFKHAMLCTNEDKNQLFIVGGDQSVNLKDFGIKDPHETETLGEVTKIEYFTDKEHLGSEGGTAVYVHKFRTTNGNRGHKTVRMARNPDLIYYLRDEHLEFSGGSYFIRAEGIDL